MSGFLTAAYHPKNPEYRAKRRSIIDRELKGMSNQQLDESFLFAASQPAPENTKEMSRRVMTDLVSSFNGQMPEKLKSILDTTGGGSSGGSVLIRQDLEPYLYRLFVNVFPAFEKIRHLPSNGLIHSYNQITAFDGASLGSSIITELGTVNYQVSQFNRASANIAVFATGRGASFKEQAAVRAGGMSYDVLATELAGGMTRLATDVQWQMFAGNSTTTGVVTGTTETGLYIGAGYDGMRQQLGAAGVYTANNSIQQDRGTLNMLECIQYVAARGANAGGAPDLALLSMMSKNALDTEQQHNKIYTDNTTEIVPGVVCNRIQAANGIIEILPVPGVTMGNYFRTSDNVSVEDIYVVQSQFMALRYLWADNFTILEIPSGVDSVLSSRYIVFCMYGLEIATPPFMGKVRVPVN